ncbi:threonine ammonia-lyase [soil metagenome]
MTVTLADVRAAAGQIAGQLHRTPALSATQLGERAGCRLMLKAECLQKTGSFKPRGALHRLAHTSRADLDRGLVTVSAGNHAQGLAWAAARVDARCTVVMPADAPLAKVSAARSYGAEVVLHGTIGESYARMEQLRHERGLVLVHPYDDPLIVAGQGTVGLEIVEQVPDVDVIVCPVGGGGLISGVAVAAKALRPSVRVVGVEPEGAAAMAASLRAGEVVRLERVDTIADGLAAPTVGAVGFELARRLVDEVVTVDDRQIAQALLAVQRYAKIVTEPGGAAGVAALLAGRVRGLDGARVVAVLTGGNLDLGRMPALLDLAA